MNKPIHYLPCSIICHGECELVLAKQIQNKKRRNLNPLAKDNGRQPIMINTLNHYLETMFPDKKVYLRKYRDLLLIDGNSILNHKIFAIMDKDATSDKMFEEYKNKQLFKDYWWGVEELIEPIYFNPDMDTVFAKHGVIIDTKRHKPSQYFKLLTTQYDKIIGILKSLDHKESNIKVLFDYLNNIMNYESKNALKTK